jgi:hypothetical protein
MSSIPSQLLVGGREQCSRARRFARINLNGLPQDHHFDGVAAPRNQPILPVLRASARRAGCATIRIAGVSEPLIYTTDATRLIIEGGSGLN